MIRVDLSFRQRKLTLKLAWISRFLSNILASIDQVFLINFQFQVSKLKFWCQKRQLNYFRITQAQFFCRIWVDSKTFDYRKRCEIDWWKLEIPKWNFIGMDSESMWKWHGLWSFSGAVWWWRQCWTSSTSFVDNSLQVRKLQVHTVRKS